MKFEIDTAAYDAFSCETFAKEYFLPEKPLLLRGVSVPEAPEISTEYVKRRFLKEGARRPGWIVSGLVDDEVLKIPDLVKRTLARNDVHLSTTPMRLFLQPEGHRTLPHFDGNSLHGFNLQVRGCKRWIIVSPDTPLPSAPFTNISMVPERYEYDSGQHDFCTFTTNPGDMLFLPRYWGHEVYALEKTNLSFNWVFTPSFSNGSNRTGRRENELAALASRYPLIDRIFCFGRFDDFGGNGRELLQVYGRGVGTLAVAGRFLRETLGYPRLLLRLRQVRSGIHEYKRNNFRI